MKKILRPTQFIVLSISVALLLFAGLIWAVSQFANGGEAVANNASANAGITFSATKEATWTNTDKTTADVTITTTINEERITETTPNILFIGTMCSAHTLDATKLQSSINALASIGNVDYFLKQNSASSNPDISGSLSKGGTISDETKNYWSTIMPTGNHQALGKFFDAIYDQCKTKGKKYDNIVFEFDGTRIADYYGDASQTENPKSTHEADAVSILKTYYDKHKVIWITDGGDCTGKYVTKGFYRPTKVYDAHRETGLNLSVDQYNSLLGFTAPSFYAPSKTDPKWAAVQTLHANDSFLEQNTLADDRQLLYSNTQEQIAAKVTAAANTFYYTFNVSDTLVSNQLLTIKDVKAYISKTGAEGSYTEYTDGTITVDHDKNQVLFKAGTLKGLNYVKLVISVEDTGKFKVSTSSEVARDPNNDLPALLVMSPQQTDDVNAQATTLKKLSWADQVIYTVATSVIGGTITPTTKAATGETVDVNFAPETGKILKSITIDDVAQTITGEESTQQFAKISSDHKIDVVYGSKYNVSFVSGIDPTKELYPTQVVWNGEKATDPGEPEELEGYIFSGWYTDQQCTTKFDFDTPINKDTILYAGFTKIWKVVFIADDKVVKEVEAPNNTLIEAPDAPKKDGYVFKGWYADKEYTVAIDFKTTPITNNMTCYAKYEVVKDEVVVPVVNKTVKTGDIACLSLICVMMIVSISAGAISVRLHKNRNRN